MVDATIESEAAMFFLRRQSSDSTRTIQRSLAKIWKLWKKVIEKNEKQSLRIYIYIDIDIGRPGVVT